MTENEQGIHLVFARLCSGSVTPFIFFTIRKKQRLTAARFLPFGIVAQMADATEDVKAMLGSARVSIKEIQDALWYYYFDVDQTVSYLIGESSLSLSLSLFLVPVLWE